MAEGLGGFGFRGFGSDWGWGLSDFESLNVWTYSLKASKSTPDLEVHGSGLVGL